MSWDLKETFKQLVSSRNETDNALSCTLNLEIVDSFDGVRNQVHLEFESVVEHLNKQREKLLAEIAEKEKQALDEAKRRQNEMEAINVEWSKLSVKIRAVEEQYQTEPSEALHKEAALLLLETMKLKHKRRKLLFDVGCKLEHESSYESDEFFEKEDFMGSLVAMATPDSSNELIKAGALCKLFKTQELLDPETDKIEIDTKSKDLIVAMITLANGNIVTASQGDGKLKQWNPFTRKERSDFSPYIKSGGRSLVALPELGGFAAGTDRGLILRFKNNVYDEEPETVEVFESFQGHDGPVESLCNMSNGVLASGGSHDLLIKLWKNKACIKTLRGHESFIYSLVKLLNGNLASGSRDHTVKIWNVSTGACLHTFTEHEHRIWSLALLQNGLLVSASEDKTIRIWDTDNRKLVETIETGNDASFQSLSVLPNGDLAFVGQGDTVTVYNSRDFKDFKQFKFEKYSHSLATNASGDLIAVGSPGIIQILPSIFSPILGSP